MATIKMKTVCIVGAGPAGLVAAKTFMQQENFVVTVYEAADRVGGMWRAQPGEQGDKCSPEMRTNLSRFTVAFPDLSWSSVDLSDPQTGFAPASPPMFPKAWQVGRYLEAYKTKFNLGSAISLNRRVIRTWLDVEYKIWQVITEDALTRSHETRKFDYLVVASGFFDKSGRSFSPSTNGNLPNIQHSSQFRDLAQLTHTAGKIVVVGGSISGSEAAAQAAFQISDAKYSPGKLKSIHADSKVYHILNRPFYCLPRYLPQDPLNPKIQDFNLAPRFLPLDLILYNLSRRSDGEITAAITTTPPEKAEKGHEFMQSLLGGDQRDLGRPELMYKPELRQHPGYVGLTDTYAGFVRSGLIIPIQGWLNRIEQQDQNHLFDVAFQQFEPWYYSPLQTAKRKTTLNDVTGIIEATGYENKLDYLDDSVKDLLYYDPSCPRIPLLLSRGSILAEIPSIGFVGFYEGPYWGVMEMQARFIAETWTRYASDPGSRPKVDLYEHHVTERMRKAIKHERSLQIPQFWMADYPGLIEEFAREVGVVRDDAAFGRQSGPIFPSRYHGSVTDTEAAIVVEEVATILKGSESRRFVAAAVFSGMHGGWTLQRKIDSRNAASPGGTFSGTAHFHPRAPTLPVYAAEYLYIEEGMLRMDNGYTFPATRRYAYRYDETVDKITAWFVQDDGESVGALFNTWDFYAPDDDYHGWMAKGHHWCDPDTYVNTCEFRFRGAGLKMFGITYQVDGPNKDYAHESWYERPLAEHMACVENNPRANS